MQMYLQQTVKRMVVATYVSYGSKHAAPPICQKAYRMPLTKRATVDKLISEILADHIIRPINLAYARPILLVPMKDGEK